MWSVSHSLGQKNPYNNTHFVSAQASCMQVIEAIGGLHVVTPYVDHRQVPLSLTINITFIVQNSITLLL